MNAALNLLSGVLLALGCLLALTSAVGVLRMPDFFSRIHPAGKNDSLAQLLIVFALCLQAGWSLVTLKLLFISCFLLITSPSAAYAIARAAHLDGRQPWRRPEQTS